MTIYVALTVAVLVYLILLWQSPDLSLSGLTRTGPRTNPLSLGISLTFMWLLATAVLILAVLRKINAGNIVLVVSGAVVALAYLVFISERFYFGDYKAYVRAAENIVAGQPFHSRYIYPPFMASVLAHIHRALGSQVAVLACFIQNILSLWAFFILGSLLLRRSGLSLHLSSILLAVAMIANVPVLRNVKYVQTNLSYTDLILAAILVLPRSRLLSAISLAVGTHLKVVPVLLLPLFAFTMLFLGLPAAKALEQKHGDDPSLVVLDEAVGMWIAAAFLPKIWWVMLAAFILFRVFDIVKPQPARYFDRMGGGGGIMMDDVIAAVYANIVMQIVLLFV